MESLSPCIPELTADILTGIVDGVVVTDAADTILIWNRAAEEITGIAGTDAVGKNIKAVFYDNPAVDELQGLLPGLGRAGGFDRGATLDKAFASLGRLEGVRTG